MQQYCNVESSTFAKMSRLSVPGTVSPRFKKTAASSKMGAETSLTNRTEGNHGWQRTDPHANDLSKEDCRTMINS